MQIYLVGGALRDELLGLAVAERDWVVVGARPEDLVAQGYRPVGHDFPVFLHPETQEEYALARTERKSGRGYHGFTFHTGPDVTLEEDLRRRDLTVNAMARSSDGELVDPYGGQQDLERRVLRHVSEAFSEDPVRILRVARFAAQLAGLGFWVAEETVTRMHAMVEAGEAGELVAERVLQELRRALVEPNPEQFVSVLVACGAWSIIFPQLPDADAVTDILKKAAGASLIESGRFACMSFFSPDPQALCEALRVPKEFSSASNSLCTQFPVWSALAPDDAEGMLQVIESIGALRQARRLDEFSQAAQVLAAAQGLDCTQIARQMRAALTAIAQCDEQAAAKGDPAGAAERVRQARLQSVREGIKP